MPTFWAKAFLSVTILSPKRHSKAAIKRLETSFFALIIQNIEK